MEVYTAQLGEETEKQEAPTPRFTKNKYCVVPRK
jgi:hypothetical protein